MDPGREAEVFSDPEDPTPVRGEEDEDEEEKEEVEDEEEDARIFNAWMQQYRGKQQEKLGQEQNEEEVEEAQGPSSASSDSVEPMMCLKVGRRASLPCPNTLSAMQLSRLHSSTRAPVTARVLLRRSSSRRLLPSQQEASGPSPERRPSLIPTIPEAMAPERKGQFRRRNAMSLSDADSVCLICHHELNQGAGGTRELPCTHTFHKECIEEWLWRKQSCPTCHVQVSVPQPGYWTSTRVKVP